MNPRQYPTITEPLDAADLIEPFRCTDQPTSSYFAGSSLARHAADLGRTWVLRRADDDPPALPAVLGYYTLVRFAVAAVVEGRGVGQHLLQDALTRAVMVADQVGAMGIVATAQSHRALEWCKRHGFVELTTEPVRRMLLPMRLARRAVRAVFGG